MAVPDDIRQDYHTTYPLFSALAITDTAAHNSSSAEVGGYKTRAIEVISTLNQAASVQVQVSDDGINFANVGSAQTVAIGANVAFGADVVAALGQPYEYVRLVATCATAPASGALSAFVGVTAS